MKDGERERCWLWGRIWRRGGKGMEARHRLQRHCCRTIAGCRRLRRLDRRRLQRLRRVGRKLGGWDLANLLDGRGVENLLGGRGFANLLDRRTGLLAAICQVGFGDCADLGFRRRHCRRWCHLGHERRLVCRAWSYLDTRRRHCTGTPARSAGPYDQRGRRSRRGRFAAGWLGGSRRGRVAPIPFAIVPPIVHCARVLPRVFRRLHRTAKKRRAGGVAASDLCTDIGQIWEQHELQPTASAHRAQG